MALCRMECADGEGDSLNCPVFIPAASRYPIPFNLRACIPVPCITSRCRVNKCCCCGGGDQQSRSLLLDSTAACFSQTTSSSSVLFPPSPLPPELLLWSLYWPCISPLASWFSVFTCDFATSDSGTIPGLLLHPPIPSSTASYLRLGRYRSAWFGDCYFTRTPRLDFCLSCSARTLLGWPRTRRQAVRWKVRPRCPRLNQLCYFTNMGLRLYDN
jgi:hypothetical protein